MEETFIIQLTIKLMAKDELMKGYYTGEFILTDGTKIAAITPNIMNAIKITGKNAIIQIMNEIALYKNVITLHAFKTEN